jgi:hypothetical protein
MKITEQTLNELKLKDHNRQWLWGVLFGTSFVVVGLVMSQIFFSDKRSISFAFR